MSSWVLLGMRVLIVLATVWLVFVVPRWMDHGFYYQCPSFNCFTSASWAILSLVIGLVTGVIMNLALSAWVRDKRIFE